MELPPTTSALINILSVSNTDRPAFNTRSQTQQCLAPDASSTQPSITPDVASTLDHTPKSVTADRLETLLQMQKTDPFCKWIFKHLSNGKHLSMNKTSSPMSEVYYIYMSQMQVRSFLL